MTEHDDPTIAQDETSQTAVTAEGQDEGEELSREEKLKAKLKETVQVQAEDVGPLRKMLTITIPRETIDEQLKEQYDELRQEAVVPGFRRGRAPQRLIEKRFGSDVGEQVSSSLLGNAYFAAIDKAEIKTIGDPLILVKVTEEKSREGGRFEPKESEKLQPLGEALEHKKVPKEGDWVYACEVELRPAFELPNLEGIEVKKPRLSVTDEDVDREIKRIMMMRSTFRVVEDGAVEADDLLVGKYTLTVDGATIQAEENAIVAARSQRFKGVLLEGFGDAAKGRKVGQTAELSVTIPDDFDQVDVRGKTGTATLEIQEIKRLHIPQPDEGFLKQMGWDSLEEFRLFLRERLERQVQDQIRQHQLDQIADYLEAQADFDVPAGVSQRQAERIVARRMLELFRAGLPEAEISKRIDEMRSTASEEARRELKRFFVIEAIAEKENVEVSEEEINATIAEIAQRRDQRFDRVRDEILGTNHFSTLYAALQERKVLEMLLTKAKVVEEAEEKAEG
jgi:trigger factor